MFGYWRNRLVAADKTKRVGICLSLAAAKRNCRFTRIFSPIKTQMNINTDRPKKCTMYKIHLN
jgi:hypothetical protein